MFNIINTIVAALFVAIFVSLFTMSFQPTGFKVTCDNASFTMPAGTKANAEAAAKKYTGCNITKMQFKG